MKKFYTEQQRKFSLSVLLAFSVVSFLFIFPITFSRKSFYIDILAIISDIFILLLGVLILNLLFFSSHRKAVLNSLKVYLLLIFPLTVVTGLLMVLTAQGENYVRKVFREWATRDVCGGWNYSCIAPTSLKEQIAGDVVLIASFIFFLVIASILILLFWARHGAGDRAIGVKDLRSVMLALLIGALMPITIFWLGSFFKVLGQPVFAIFASISLILMFYPVIFLTARYIDFAKVNRVVISRRNIFGNAIYLLIIFTIIAAAVPFFNSSDERDIRQAKARYAKSIPGSFIYHEVNKCWRAYYRYYVKADYIYARKKECVYIPESFS